MLEEHDAGSLLSVILLVVHQDDHPFRIHVLSWTQGISSITYGSSDVTCVELEITEFTEESLHDSVDVLLKAVHLIGLVVSLKVGDHPLHVILQVVHVVGLLAKAGLDQPVHTEVAQPKCN